MVFLFRFLRSLALPSIMPKTAQASHLKRRNPFLIRGVERWGRSISFTKRGKWAKKKNEWKPVLKKKIEKTPKVKPFNKGETRTIKKKLPRFFSADDVRKPIPSRKHHHRPTRLRSSIRPGTVLILLAGRFRGKRVVFLKQLTSGLLLVTGPYKINGVPLRRVNQAYVIATSTIVELPELKLDEKLDDKFFKPQKEKTKKPKTEAEFFNKETKKKELKPERVELQKTVDSQVLAAVKKQPLLKAYLGARFSLKQGQFPHLLKF